MSARAFLLLCLPIAACSSDPSAPHPTPGGAGAAAGGASSAGQGNAAGASTAGAGSSAGGAAAGASDGGAGATAGAPGGAGASTGGDTGSAGSGGASGGAGGTNGAAGSAGSAGAGVPPGYAGTPFKVLTIPGFIYAADYDKGGAGVGYCRVGAANPPSVATCMTAKINDWCCGTQKGCDERNQPTVCPIYRQDLDNAGLSHMNTGEPDRYSVASPTWVAGANGPTLTGPAVAAGGDVLQHANTTTPDDTYLSYTYTGQWQQYTVQVASAGSYTIGGEMASPDGTTIRFDFGGGISTGVMTVPTSPTANCKCPETYHSWNIVNNIGSVTFPAAGTYLMRFTLLTQQFNPLFFTFTKM
jgi:hypothetical protein